MQRLTHMTIMQFLSQFLDKYADLWEAYFEPTLVRVTIVESHTVLGLGKKQPAFNKDTGHMCCQSHDKY